MVRTPPSVKRHREEGPKSVRAAVITVSDTRTPDTDDNGKYIRQALEGKGHEVVRHSLCKDEKSELKAELDKIFATRCDVIVINGGTGIAPRDITIETVESALEKRIDGFGELFRQLSYEEIGTPAMLSRAVAGTSKGRILFCLPGSPDAVRLAMEKLVLPELGHLVHMAKGH